MRTAWNATAGRRPYLPLKGSEEADVVIAGGGLTGISVAYLLAKEGLKVAVLEKDHLGADATERTTAFLTCVVDTELQSLVKMFGSRNAGLVWRSHQDAIDGVERIVKEESIECEFKRCSNYMFAWDEKDFETLEEEHRCAQRYDFPTFLHRHNNLNFENSGYLEVKNQAKFHPLKYLYQLAERARALGVQIFERSEVLSIKNRGKFVIAEAKNGQVRAQTAVIATYDPLGNPQVTRYKKGMYTTYIIEADVPQGTFKEATYEDLNLPYNYFRVDPLENKDRVIIGGADHRSEISIDQKKNYRAVESVLKSLLGDRPYKVVRRWNGPILEPSDGLALVGWVNKNQLCACAFSGNGMTYAQIAAMVFRDLILGRKNPYAKLYDPARPMKVKRLLRKGIDYTEEFIKGAMKNVVRFRK